MWFVLPVDSFLLRIVFTFMNIIRAGKHTRSLYWYGAITELKIWFFSLYEPGSTESIFGQPHRSYNDFPTLPGICMWPLGGRLYNLGWLYPSLT